MTQTKAYVKIIHKVKLFEVVCRFTNFTKEKVVRNEIWNKRQ